MKTAFTSTTTAAATSWGLLVVLGVVAALLAAAEAHSGDDLVYGYECKSNKCLKMELSEQNYDTAVSLAVCRLFCGDAIGTLLPKPTGAVKIEPYTVHVDWTKVNFEVPGDAKQLPLWRRNEERFMRMVAGQVPNPEALRRGGYPLTVSITVQDAARDGGGDEVPRLTLDTDESYRLVVAMQEDKSVRAEVRAETFFGARHGLETLAQLVVFDDIRRELQIAAKTEIEDGPRYKWRGLLLDTSRNFYSVPAIKRTLDAMAMVKLNTFHWHITDSHSFPLQLKSQPQLYKLGAYKPSKVYTHDQIADIVEYGRERGIRVMPEFDAPAHVGEGWQHMNMTACFNAQPWKDFCVEPPCGQLDPTVPELYNVLEDIYREMFDLFHPDVFHMGGDEVSVQCWNSSERIRTWMTNEKQWPLDKESFMRLWGHFQEEALARVDRINSDTAQQQPTVRPPIILWTSHLTEEPFIDQYLDKSRYIIQIWTKGGDAVIGDILRRGYRMIVSNYDALYFDCGGAGWVTDGNNWCSPYIGWQKVYDNDLEAITGHPANPLVLGAEAAIWSEQIDEQTLDSRLWPRASALAERLWSQPSGGWRSAESRMLMHRERLVQNQIGAEALQPEWCLQNEGECPIDAY